MKARSAVPGVAGVDGQGGGGEGGGGGGREPVLLQRDDYVVRSLDVQSGREAWNVTLSEIFAVGRRGGAEERHGRVVGAGAFEGMAWEGEEEEWDEAWGGEDDDGEGEEGGEDVLVLPDMVWLDERMLQASDPESGEVLWERALPSAPMGMYTVREGRWLHMEAPEPQYGAHGGQGERRVVEGPGLALGGRRLGRGEGGVVGFVGGALGGKGGVRAGARVGGGQVAGPLGPGGPIATARAMRKYGMALSMGRVDAEGGEGMGVGRRASSSSSSSSSTYFLRRLLDFTPFARLSSTSWSGRERERESGAAVSPGDLGGATGRGGVPPGSGPGSGFRTCNEWGRLHGQRPLALLLPPGEDKAPRAEGGNVYEAMVSTSPTTPLLLTYMGASTESSEGEENGMCDAYRLSTGQEGVEGVDGGDASFHVELEGSFALLVMVVVALGMVLAAVAVAMARWRSGRRAWTAWLGGERPEEGAYAGQGEAGAVGLDLQEKTWHAHAQPGVDCDGSEARQSTSPTPRTPSQLSPASESKSMEGQPLQRLQAMHRGVGLRSSWSFDTASEIVPHATPRSRSSRDARASSTAPVLVPPQSQINSGAQLLTGTTGPATTATGVINKMNTKREQRQLKHAVPLGSQTAPKPTPGLDVQAQNLSTAVLSDAEGNPMLYLSNQRYRNEFNEACTLGKGGFGTVFRSTNKLDGHDYAIKKIRLSSAARWSQQLEKVLREVKILALLDHPNIIRYYQAWLERLAPEDLLAAAVGNAAALVSSGLSHKGEDMGTTWHGDNGEGFSSTFSGSEAESMLSRGGGGLSALWSQKRGRGTRPKALSLHGDDGDDGEDGVDRGDLEDLVSGGSGGGYGEGSEDGVGLVEPEKGTKVPYSSSARKALNGTRRHDLTPPCAPNGQEGEERDGGEADSHNARGCELETKTRGRVHASGLPLSRRTASMESFARRTALQQHQGGKGRGEQGRRESVEMSEHSRISDWSEEEEEDVSGYSESDTKREDDEQSNGLVIWARSPDVSVDSGEGGAASAHSMSSTSGGRVRCEGGSSSSHGKGESSRPTGERLPSRRKSNAPSPTSKRGWQYSSVSLDNQTGNDGVAKRKTLTYTRGKARRRREPVVFDLCLYIQMQYCSNRTLKDFLDAPSRAHRVDKAEALQLALQIARGVTYVHARGLIHRDLKPTNCFLVGEKGHTVKIGDFGLSRHVGAVEGVDGRNGAGTPPSPAGARKGNEGKSWTDGVEDGEEFGNTAGVGTPVYGSPEQLSGGDYDEKTDVFSLGVMLFELFHPAFGTGMERMLTMRKIHEGKMPPAWSDENGEMVEMLGRMLNRLPARRPRAAEVVSKLEFLQGKPLVLPLDFDQFPRDAVLLRAETGERDGMLQEVINGIKAQGSAGVMKQYGFRSSSDGRAIIEVLLDGSGEGKGEEIDRIVKHLRGVEDMISCNLVGVGPNPASFSTFIPPPSPLSTSLDSSTTALPVSGTEKRGE
ncbi:eukaryotic translation initiation factor 2-alpha kinase 3 [Nannochloropsis gaditana]|uniref:non-specific serine/threonine protein kinase n=1 Tax=Nannochloropsis gaditana TaxID=72520 RepID=W7U5D1_9STRA|nr:eukaryotic translation initiation factor 2-alpha kinase 3 [Nannochloropsis gaditana]